MRKQKVIQKQRWRRRNRVRRTIRGSAAKPRLSVYRSNRNISCQLIDDASGRTLVAASTMEAGLRAQAEYGGNRGAAALVGRTVAERALAAGVTAACFDRGAYRYHGRVAALADAAREAGLKL